MPLVQMTVLALRHMREGVEFHGHHPHHPVDTGQVRQDDGSDPARSGRIGWIVAGSLAAGLVAALLLVAAPFIRVQENDITGAVLWGFGLGWAMLAVLSVRFTDQPQRWAVVPAVFMGVSGLLLVAFGSGVNDALRWVWPPALLALAVWMTVQAHRHLHSHSSSVAALPGDRGHGPCLGGRGLRDRARAPG